MDQSDDIKQLLTEIRDVQRDHLDEYKRVTERMLEIQGEAVRQQIAIGSLYKRVVFVGAVLILGLLLYLFFFVRLVS